MGRIRERGDDVTVWTARADPLDSRAPHGLLAQAIRRTVGIADDEPLGVRQERLREHLARSLPPLEAVRAFPFLTEMIGAPLDDAEGDALRLNPWHTGPGIKPLGVLQALRRFAYVGSQNQRG
jgi:hypothetical protein